MAGNDGWRQVVADAVEVRAADTARKNRGASDHANISRVGFGSEAHPYIVRAAKKRGISVSGYIRRATAAMAALDLGLDPKEIFEKDVAITPIGRIGAKPSKDLDGELYGTWEVVFVDTDPG